MIWKGKRLKEKVMSYLLIFGCHKNFFRSFGRTLEQYKVALDGTLRAVNFLDRSLL